VERRLCLGDHLGTDAVAGHHSDAVAGGHCSGILSVIRSSSIAISTPQSIGLITSCTVGGNELPTVIHTTVGIIAGTTTRITSARCPAPHQSRSATGERPAARPKRSAAARLPPPRTA